MKSYLSIFLSLLLCSCSVGGNKENLKKAYRLLNTDPDSAMIRDVYIYCNTQNSPVGIQIHGCIN